MKKVILSLLAVLSIVLLSMTFGSCTKEEIVVNTGIQVFTKDNPLPLSLSENTCRFWIDDVSFKIAKGAGYGCDQDYDYPNQRWGDQYNCGKWRTLEVKLYYGSVFGEKWISEKTTTLIMDENTYYNGRELIDQFGIITGYFSVRPNPLGINCMRINNFQEF